MTLPKSIGSVISENIDLLCIMFLIFMSFGFMLLVMYFPPPQKSIDLKDCRLTPVQNDNFDIQCPGPSR